MQTENPRDERPPLPMSAAGRRAMRRVLFAAEMLAWAVFFTFATLFLAARYWLLPNIENYREQIIAAVSQAIGLPVKVGAIYADWRGLRPELQLADVRIFDAEGREALVLTSVKNIVAWRTLVFGQLRLHAFEIQDPKLTVRRDRDDVIYVAGIRLSREKGDGKLTDWVLSQREIIVSHAEIEWIDERRDAPPLALSALNFRLLNDGDEHAIGLSARPPAALGSNVELRAELVGHSVTLPSAWNGRVFAEVGDTDLAAWRAWVDYPIDLRAGQGALRVWATLGGGRPIRATADVVLSKVVARLGDDLPLLELASVSGRMQGRDSGTTYQLAGRNLRLAPELAPELPATSFQLQLDRDAANQIARGSLSANSIELAPLARLAAYLPFPAGVRTLLAELEPRGALLDVKFDWQGPLPTPEKFSARGRFAALGMNAWGRIPGFLNLSGSFEANETKGTLFLAAQGAELDLPKVFPEPRLKLDSLSGEVGWVREARGGVPETVAVQIANLGFANADAAGTAFGHYAFNGSGPGSIDLSAKLSRADARQTERYLPSVVGGRVRAWLRSAVIDGRSHDVRLRLRGDLHDFPFVDPASGEFQIAAKVENAVIDYVEGWPRIEDIDGDMTFERDRMEVIGRSATILGAKLSGVRVSIPSLLGAHTEVHVSGVAEGPTAEFLRYIQLSPVRRMVSGLTDGIAANGRGRLRLNLDLPLAAMDRSRVDGDYQFSGNNVTLTSRLPPVERADGRVTFSENSFSVRDVKGAWLGGQTTISGGTRPDAQALLQFRGDATLAGLRPAFELPWRPQLSGGTSYTATVTLRGREMRTLVESGLSGVASTLPPPLTKSAAETLPLRVEIATLENGDQISVALGANVRAEFSRRSTPDAIVVQRAALAFGTAAAAQPKLPEGSGILLTGNLPELDLDRWLPLLTGSGGGGAGTTSFDMRLGTLDAFGKRLNRVAIRGVADAKGWSANLAAQEMNGDLAYRNEGRGHLTGRFADFSPPAGYPEAPKSSGAQDLPAVDLIAESFTFRGRKVGRVEIAAQHEGGNWRIDKLVNVTPESMLTGKGIWQTGEKSRTSVDFDVEVNDIGRYLERLGHLEKVKGGQAKLHGSLTWSGDPVAVDYPSLSGQVSLEAENAQVLEIDPGIGKVLSLFKLDLADAFGKGFSFSRVTGSGKIERGVLRTEDVRVRGSSADIFMRGDSDLARETQNLRLRVVPSLGEGISSVAGFFAGPVVGLVSLLAQRLLKNPLGQIFAYEYSVSGSWSDPKVERVESARSRPEPGPDDAEPAPAAQAQ